MADEQDVKATDEVPVAVPERWPLDYDKLKKGSVIPREKLAEIFGVDWKQQKYTFDAMALKTQIERELAHRGQFVMVVMKHYNMLILEDKAASEVANSRFMRGIKKSRKAHIYTIRVDTSEFSEEEKTKHHRIIQIQASTLVAAYNQLGKILRVPDTKPTVRQLPVPKPAPTPKKDPLSTYKTVNPTRLGAKAQPTS